LKTRIELLNQGSGKSLWEKEIRIRVLIKQENLPILFKENSIILPQLDPQDVSNIPLQKVAFIC